MPATKIIAVVGPTGVGKSDLAMTLARTFNGEIIGADARQIYRLTDIGTAKPSPADRAEIPHQLVDCVPPDQPYSLALFLSQAKQAIRNAKTRDRLPIIVGGAGQYIWALLEGWQTPQAKPNPKLRAQLEARLADHGIADLYAELSRLTPETARRTDPRNPRRIIRALEIAHANPDNPNAHASPPRKIPPDYDARIIGLTMERSALYARIDARIDAQIGQGWLDETRALLAAGYSPDRHPALSGIGYAELTAHINGELPLNEAVQRIKSRTRRYARSQYNWFRPTDPRIHWLQAPPNIPSALRDISLWLRTDDPPPNDPPAPH